MHFALSTENYALLATEMQDKYSVWDERGQNSIRQSLITVRKGAKKHVQTQIAFFTQKISLCQNAIVLIKHKSSNKSSRQRNRGVWEGNFAVDQQEACMRVLSACGICVLQAGRREKNSSVERTVGGT